MSELQISLFVIAILALAGLYLAGKWQERRLLRRLTKELGGEVGDPLFDEYQDRTSVARFGDGVGRRRIEPRMEDRSVPEAPKPEPSQGIAEPGQSEPPVAARHPDWIEDPLLDCVLELRCARAVDGVAFIDAGMPLTASAWPLPVAFVVWDARAQQWIHPGRFGYYTDALAAIQIANRKRVLSLEEVERFVSVVRKTAAALDADCDPPDPERVAAAARELDSLCARFDVRIGLNLRSTGGPWTQAQVDTAACQAGLISIDGLSWVEVPSEPQIPLRLSIDAVVSAGACLELDVPRTAEGAAVVQRMFRLGNQLAASLNARMLDDVGRPIDAQSVAAIEAQLGKLFEDMKAAGIDPGGQRARRLYV
jgi:ZipA, C-terminal FtsZ-binding domain